MTKKLIVLFLMVSHQLFCMEEVKYAIDYYAVTDQGKRIYQEDRHMVKQYTKGTFFGIYDGHGGDEVAEYLNDKYAAQFAKTTGSAEMRMKETFAGMEK